MGGIISMTIGLSHFLTVAAAVAAIGISIMLVYISNLG